MMSRRIDLPALAAALLLATAGALLAEEPMRTHVSGDQGKQIFRKANCFGCHKWHGDGGGSYGGAALSLRRTELDRAQIIEIVRCGRPNTGMPYHERGAYSDGRCNGLTEKDLGDGMPPQAPQPLRLSEIEAVTDYVIAAIKGRGEPTLDECLAFWGGESRMCNPYREGAQAGTKP
jgi:mono/diheme cytochrome c family protein